LFESKKYQEKGNIHWKDVENRGSDVDLAKPSLVKYYSSPGDIDYVYQNIEPSESGQVLVDRKRHKNALIYTWRLNERQGEVYKHTYGDKDTFVMGFAMDGKALDFAQSAKIPDRIIMGGERIPGVAGAASGKKPTLALLHMDDHGTPVFLHRTGQKRHTGGVFDLDDHKSCIDGLDDVLDNVKKTEKDVLASGHFNKPMRNPDYLFKETFPIRKDIRMKPRPFQKKNL
jgi:hypothetical protein